MNNYIGLIIAVETYHETNVLPVKYSIEDATEFRDSLIALGCDGDRLELITNEKATRTTIIEKVKAISRQATDKDKIIFYYAGHGLFYNGNNLLTCVDTLQSAIPETTVDLNFLMGQFDKAKTDQVIAFLDCCHSGIEFNHLERDMVSEFSNEYLKHLFSNAEHLTVFASCKSNEKSQSDIQRKHGAWSYYLLEALKGNADSSIYQDGILFSDQLQKYLLDNTVRRVKHITYNKANQTPIKYGKETTDKFIVADLSILFEARASKINAEGIEVMQATISTSKVDSVSNLPGFNKDGGHKLPKVIDSYHENWIKKLSLDLIKDELNEIGRKLKSELNYKRKDIQSPIVEEGAGQLSTVDFDFVISVTQSSDKASSYILTRSIENFRNQDIFSKPEFNKIFNHTFDKIEFTLSGKLNIEDIIDRIELIDNDEVIDVDYENTDLSKCTVYINGLKGHIDLTENSFKIVSDIKKSPNELVLVFREAYTLISQHKVPTTLL